MQTFLLLVAVDNDIALGRNLLVRQLVSLLFLVLVADFVVFQIDGGIRGVIQLYPRVGELLDVIHDAFYVRLHQLVDY